MMNKRNRTIFTMILAAVLILTAALPASALTYSKVNGKKYTHPAKYRSSRYKVFNGVDTSEFQGGINWKKVKAAGVDFAFIRCGATLGGYTKLKRYADTRFYRSATAAKAAGVEVGVYYFSLATSASEAKQEAEFAISRTKAAGLPKGTKIIMDYEFLNGSRLNKAYSKWKKLGTTYARYRLTYIAKAFLNKVRSAGYEPVFYSYRSLVDWSGRRFNMTSAHSRIMNLSSYSFWLAQYSSETGYLSSVSGSRMEYWQFTSSGSVSGISGKCDRDFMYVDSYGTGTASNTKSIRRASIHLSASSYTYTGTPRMPAVTVRYGGTKLVKNRDYLVSYYRNVAKGTAYVMIKGIGNYSNSVLKTFTIKGTGSGSNSQSSSAAPATPSKVKGLQPTVNASKNKISVSFERASNANDYMVIWRINRKGIWHTALTKGKTSVTLNVHAKDAVEIRARAINRKGSRTAYGAYSGTLRRYVVSGSVRAWAEPSKKRLRAVWSKVRDSKGTVTYNALVTVNGTSKRSWKMAGTSMAFAAGSGSRYKVRVKPYLTMKGVRYAGCYDSSYSTKNGNALMTTAPIRSLTGLKRGILVQVQKSSSAGGYQAAASQFTYFNGARIATVSGNTKTQIKMKNLKRSNYRYYVKTRAYRDADGVRYYGAWSGLRSVKTK